MKYSPSAIILMILLAIRAIGQSLNLLLQNQLAIGISLFIALIFGFLYTIAFVGIFKKTRWGLILVLFIGLIDLVSAIIYVNLNGRLSAIIVDIVLIILSITILTRIKKK
jgi:hypothetical protein